MTAHHLACDRFELLCRQAAGRPIPAPPAIPGRQFNAEEEPAEADLMGLSAREVADVAQISRQAAHRRIAVALETGDWSQLLAPQRQGRRACAAAARPPASPPLSLHPQEPGAPAPGLAPGAPAVATDPQACPDSSSLVTS